MEVIWMSAPTVAGNLAMDDAAARWAAATGLRRLRFWWGGPPAVVMGSSEREEQVVDAQACARLEVENLICAILAAFGLEGRSEGTSDIAVGDRKISGNAHDRRFYGFLGMTHFKLGDRDRGLTALRAAVEIDATFPGTNQPTEPIAKWKMAPSSAKAGCCPR